MGKKEGKNDQIVDLLVHSHGMCRSNGCKHKHDEKLSQIAFHRNSISQLHRTLIYTLLNIMSVYFFFTLPFLPVCRTVLFFGRSFLLPHWFEVVCILSQTSSHVQCKIASFFFHYINNEEKTLKKTGIFPLHAHC